GGVLQPDTIRPAVACEDEAGGLIGAENDSDGSCASTTSTGARNVSGDASAAPRSGSSMPMWRAGGSNPVVASIPKPQAATAPCMGFITLEHVHTSTIGT